jgi:outer membrane protein
MRTLFTVAAACVLGLVSVPAMAQSKVVALDFQRAVVDSAEFKKAYAALEAKYKPKQDQLAKSQQQLEDLSKQMRSANDLSAAGAAELQSRGARKETEVKRLQEDLEQDFTAERDAALRLVGTRMGEVVKKYADDNQLDMIVDTQAIRFVRALVDVTDKIIAAYDLAHPAK